MITSQVPVPGLLNHMPSKLDSSVMVQSSSYCKVQLEWRKTKSEHDSHRLKNTFCYFFSSKMLLSHIPTQNMDSVLKNEPSSQLFLIPSCCVKVSNRFPVTLVFFSLVPAGLSLNSFD